ncbi:MAG TPA: delta-60 repeat domain-containing protein, partial [Chryseosolibacter sp.]|nr:delta-60 repeat domain-containing protein [Chryseosolibacter sp.]
MRKSFLLLAAFMLFASPRTVAQFNTIDVSFNPGDVGFSHGEGFGGSSPYFFALAKQPDGKILAGGGFATYNGAAIPPGLVRLNVDGTRDNSFLPGTGVAAGYVSAIALQPDGKILIGGTFSFYNGTLRLRLARVNPNGSLDHSFNANVNGEDVSAIAVMPSGKIVIAGNFTAVGGSARAHIAILNPDGTLYSGFNPGTGASHQVETLAIQDDGKILVGGRFTTYNGVARHRMARVDSTGANDNDFVPNLYYGPDGVVYAILVQADQKIIVGGGVNHNFPHHGDPTPRSGLVRLNANGSNDNSFVPGVEVGEVRAVLQQSDGKIIAGGSMGHGPNVYFYKVPGGYNAHTKYWQITRVHPNGSLDIGFGPYGVVGANSTIHALLLQDDQKLIAGGEFTAFNLVHRERIARLLPDGNLDISFNPPTGSNGTLVRIARQNDGKLLIGGYMTMYNGQVRSGITRIHSDGSIDPGFNPGRGAMDEAQRPSPVLAIAVQNSGKILVGGYFSNFAEPDSESPTYLGPYTHYITRLNSDGSLDNTFIHPLTWAPGQRINDIILQPNGKILIGGYFRIGSAGYGVARLNEDGTVDPAFTKGNTNDIVYTLALDANGKILVGGHFTNYNGSSVNHLVRLNPDGTRDMSFNTGSGPSDRIYSIALQTDGKVLVGGDLNTFNGTTSPGIVRLNSDGSVDNGFVSGFTVPNSHSVKAILLQQNAKILLAGDFNTYGGIARQRLLRLNDDASLDQSFNPCGGANSRIESMLLTPAEDRLYLAGTFTAFSGCGRNRIAGIHMVSAVGSSQSICHNTAPQVLITTQGGLDCNSYSFQWQTSNDGLVFNDIPGATTQQFQPGQLTATTWYRRRTTGTCGTVTSNNIEISVYPPLAGNTILGM